MKDNNSVHIKCKCGNSGWFEEGSTVCPKCNIMYIVAADLSVRSIEPIPSAQSRQRCLARFLEFFTKKDKI